MMKNLTVKKLVELLSTVDQNATISLEGCDCAGDCVGISIGTEAYKTQVILRREDGPFELDYLQIITKVSK